ncbi:MAG: protein kinase [Acetobacteraceae bacterium]|nr:protein kinase [Acetobacteraceae bacterium]
MSGQAIPPGLTAKYEIRGTLGAGAMGVVYDAWDRLIERRVAIKVVRRPGGNDPDAIEAHARFRREAQAAGRLQHPNIVAVYDYGEDETAAWIVMELVEGGSLKKRLDAKERFPIAEIVRVMTQVLEALDYSHKRGVVHRDIKPANVMLGEGGQVKLADFGIARIENSSMTQVGTVMGTPSYMAPEQLRGEPVDLRADIWAAGVLLYQLLTGAKPFEGDFVALSHRVLHTEPPPPSALSVTCPRAFDAVVAKALAKRPEDRYPSAAAFAEAIRASASGAQASTAPPRTGDADATMVAAKPSAPPAEAPAAGPAARRGGPPWALIGGGLAAAGIAAAAAVFVMQPAPPPPPPQPATTTALRLEAETPQQGATASQPQPATLTPPQPTGISPPQPTDVTPPQQQTALLIPVRPDYRAAATAAVAAAPCGLIAAAASDSGLQLLGVAPRNETQAIAAALSARAIPPTDPAARVQVQPFDGPYCQAAALLRRVLAGPDEGPRVELDGTMPLRRGQLLRFEVRMPDWPAHLYVAYFMKSGEVAHLVPSERRPAGARVRLGDPAPGFPGWEVDEPFGTDLMVVVASERPLFPGRRPMVEPQEAYLAALGAALEGARREGARIAVRPVVVETAER